MTTTFRSIRLAGLAATIMAAACGQAQQLPDRAAAQANPAGMAMTLQDFTTRRERQILTADVDGDGRVSNAEFLGQGNAGKGDPARRFARIDRNGDGAIDKQEIAAISARQFARLDGDRNGSLTRQERAAARTAAAAKGKRSS